jgi:hypothetical protein
LEAGGGPSSGHPFVQVICAMIDAPDRSVAQGQVITPA